MTEEATQGANDDAGPCTRPDCTRDGELWVYHAGDDGWRRLCEYHTRRLHPSLEVDAWLESGYARPVELGRPVDAPETPPAGRPAAFRAVVDRAMGWT
jgi:hypothetical protein